IFPSIYYSVLYTTTPTTDIYPLSLHDALPISGKSTCAKLAARLFDVQKGKITVGGVDINEVDPEVLLSDYSMVFQDVVLFDDSRSEEHTSELQSRFDLVCRLLLEKKNLK